MKKGIVIGILILALSSQFVLAGGQVEPTATTGP